MSEDFSQIMAELFMRLAELERKQDNFVRHGAVTERKKIDKEWFVRIRVGGTDDEPMLSPWLPVSSPNGGASGLNIHWVPRVGENMTAISPSGDFEQAMVLPYFWSKNNPAPSEDPDEVVITHKDFRLALKDGVLKIESSKEIEFNSEQKIRFVGGGSELELKGGHINLVSGDIHAVGKTHLGVESKDEEGKKKAVMEGLMIGPRVLVSDKDAVEDPKVAEIMAAIAAAGDGGDG